MPRVRALMMGAASLIGSAVLVVPSGARATDVDDEIHYSLNGPTGVVFDWHGPDSTISYGSQAGVYGQTLTASNPTGIPTDETGPFWEAQISGLVPGVVYHYRIGASGDDHTFHAAPVGDFKWVDEADTGSPACKPVSGLIQQMISTDSADVVTHGGDISYANNCGVQAIHDWYVGEQAWSLVTPVQYGWGNHEYATSTLFPKESMLNYKVRTFIPNAQTSPGAGKPRVGGEDWGWFDAGHVRFISYPEPGGSLAAQVYPNWQSAADLIMAAAQADPNIWGIITWGHRAAYTSAAGSGVISPALKAAADALGDKYGTSSPGVIGGKYILNVQHHAHLGEFFSQQHGVYQIVNGGGGAGLGNFAAAPAAGSTFRLRHPEYLRTILTGHTMTVDMICGPPMPNLTQDTCTQGAITYSESIPLPT